MQQYDIIIIGGGPAGLAAAVSAYKQGVTDILLLERDDRLGGILNQCIHQGFGIQNFNKDMTGPEYAKKYVDMIEELYIPYKVDTTVLDIDSEKVITAINSVEGEFQCQAKAIILAVGCEEYAKETLDVPGCDLEGVYTAGEVQHLINREGKMPGKEMVIFGSNNLGLIMARRMTLEGAKVQVVAEPMPYPVGLKKHISHCLGDFNIPLKLNQTIVGIKGTDHVERVTIVQVDENGSPMLGTEETYACDTLLISQGFQPSKVLPNAMGLEINPITNGPCVNESLETSVEGIFVCGNALHIHDLADDVSQEAAQAGEEAAKHVQHFVVEKKEAEEGLESEARGSFLPEATLEIQATDGVRYTVPKRIRSSKVEWDTVIRFRVDKVRENMYISAYLGNKRVIHKRKPVVTPGEMESIVITKAMLDSCPDAESIRVCLEER